jgi:catechol 2,3-dioxygenase-like lactoylglutathione lyase family enzyme
LEKHLHLRPRNFAIMAFSLSTVHIYVDDPEAALGFYRDTLGLSVADEVENGGFRWITLVTETQPEIKIVLSQPHAGRSQEDGDALAALLAKGELPGPFFRSDDLDTIFEMVAASPGVEVLSEPAEQFWGARDAAVRDPAGNMIRIEQS